MAPVTPQVIRRTFDRTLLTTAQILHGTRDSSEFAGEPSVVASGIVGSILDRTDVSALDRTDS